MTRRDTAPTGAPCWIDLMTSDVERSQEFYDGLFGWTVEEADPEFGGYRNFLRDGERIAGCMPSQGIPGASDGWGVYLATDDPQRVADTAVACGGQVLSPPMDVADLGAMVTVTDAGGAVISGWRAGQHPGFRVLGEPGAPGWFELHTRDYERSLAFYRAVFGWDTHSAQDAPGIRYATLGEGEDALAGVHDAARDLPEGTAAHWAVFFAVEDADATAARVTELGGTVVTPPEDTPYGRLAEFSCPNGARFHIMGSASHH